MNRDNTSQTSSKEKLSEQLADLTFAKERIERQIIESQACIDASRERTTRR